MRSGHVASLFVLIFALAGTCHAQQVNAGTESGLPGYGSFHGGDLDQVNLANGNLHIAIPILTLKERGRTLSWQYVYDSPQWQKYWVPQPTPSNPNAGTYVVGLELNSITGWGLSTPFDWTVNYSYVTETCPTTNQTYSYTMFYSVTDPNRTKHPFPLRTEISGSCHGQTLSGPALDGSGMVLNLSSNTITLKDGTQIGIGNLIEDTNGNEASRTADTLSRNPLTVTNAAQTNYTTPLGHTISGPQYTLYTIVDSNGQSQNYRVDYTAIDASTSFCVLNGHQLSNCKDYAGNQLVPRQLTLPNGKAYAFTYNNNTFSQLASITLPTGASISYTWGSTFTAQPTPPKVPATYIGMNSVTSRTVTAGSTSPKWTYNIGGTPTVTDPTGATQDHIFSKITIGNYTSPSEYEVTTHYYDVNGMLLRTITHDYTGEPDPVNSILDNELTNIRPIRATTTLNGLVTKAETDYETFQYSCNTGCPGIATRFNPTETREYDYASGAPGPLLRRTARTFTM